MRRPVTFNLTQLHWLWDILWILFQLLQPFILFLFKRPHLLHQPLSSPRRMIEGAVLPNGASQKHPQLPSWLWNSEPITFRFPLDLINWVSWGIQPKWELKFGIINFFFFFSSFFLIDLKFNFSFLIFHDFSKLESSTVIAGTLMSKRNWWHFSSGLKFTLHSDLEYPHE